MVCVLSVFLSLKCSLFHNSNLFGSCIIRILYTECAKIKKNNSGAKRLTYSWSSQIADTRAWYKRVWCAVCQLSVSKSYT